jgi:hypothetical protein
MLRFLPQTSFIGYEEHGKYEQKDTGRDISVRM